MTYTTRLHRDYPVDHLQIFQRLDSRGLKLVPNYTPFNVVDAIVITGPLYERAVESAKRLGYNVHLIESFNYLDRVKLSPYEYDNVKIKDVFPTQYYQGQEWVNQVRLRARLDHNQVCRILNHMAAWSKCMELTSPCIILEHDSILLGAHLEQKPRNSIYCLSNSEPLAHNSNWLCMGEPFAYSVDMHSAKRMFNKIMEEGLVDPLELAIRLDQFMVLFDRKASRIRQAASSAATLASSASTLSESA